MMRRFVLITIALVTLVAIGGTEWLVPPVVQADGYIDFEDGVDSEPIQSSIPGLQFTTTEGYDWVYGDWRTDQYNGPYPDGGYYSNGNFFAWLGPNQGAGRIDFTEGCATYLQVWVSSYYGLTAEAYYSDGALAATASVEGNYDTGQMARLRVNAPPGDCFSYVILYDTGNYWLIDDLSTDAAGVPATRPPVVILPGLTGSRLDNRDSCQNRTYEVWPAVALTALDPFDLHLEHLRLAQNGSDPASPCDHISPAGIIRDVVVGPKRFDFYGPLMDRLAQAGFEVHAFDYDWRLDLRDTADQLEAFVDDVLSQTGADQVNIVDHSLGGLLGRYYVTSDPTRAAKVEQVISLGTPFLGASQPLKLLRWGDLGPAPLPLSLLFGLDPSRTKALAQNSPTAYQILPTQNYFDVYDGGYYRVEGQMKDWGQTRFVILSEHNAALALDAEDFHSDAMDDWWSAQPDTAFRLIVGSGQEGTPGVLHEFSIFDWLGFEVITWDIEPTNGDGSVPLHSADLRGNGYDYSGGVPIWYTNDLDHGGLTRADYVIDFIGAMLATPPSATAMARAHAATRLPDPSAPAVYQGSLHRFSEPSHHATVPPTPPQMGDEPFELDGGQIAAHGLVALHVYDELGSHIGPIEDGRVELGIPGGSYSAMGDGVFVTVPAGGAYTIQIESRGAEDFDLRIRDIEGLDNNLIRRTATYADAPVGLEGSAELMYDPDDLSPAPNLALDTDGDGTFDAYMPPTGDLGPEDSSDMTAPVVTIDLQGEIGAYGWYVDEVTVTINVDDDRSGVAKVEYSPNFGQDVHEYTGPFTVQAEEVSLLVVQATDHAGNKGGATARIGPLKTYVPFIMRNFGGLGAGIANGDFEDGPSGWVEYSTHGWDLIVDGFPGTVTPHSGTWAVWLGGEYDEISYIEQRVTVPPGSPYLAYWHWIASGDYCGWDFGGVIINGSTVVDVYDLCQSANTGGWVKHVVNLSAYAGQSVFVQIRAETDSSLNSNLFVDDVTFQKTSSSMQEGTALLDLENAMPKSVEMVPEDVVETGLEAEYLFPRASRP